MVDSIPHPDAPAPQPAYFQALLEKNKKRPVEDNAGALNPLPQLQLGLNDISRKVRNIGQGGPSAGLGRGGDGRSHSLLAASGVNTGRTLRDIEELATSASVRSHVPPEQTDYAHFSGVKDSLAAYHQTNFEKMWQNTVRKAQEDFDKMIDEKLHDVDWHAHRQHILEHFGLKKPQADDAGGNSSLRETGGFARSSRRGHVPGASTLGQSFGLPGMTKSIIGVPGTKAARQSVFGDVADKLPNGSMRPAPEDRVQRRKQEQYAERVKELNVARLQEQAFPIMHRFSEVEAEPSNEDTSMLVNAYKALVHITGEDATKENASGPGAVKERQYAGAYLDDTANAKGDIAIAVGKRILNGSRTFLEELFYGQLEFAVLKNPREANVGGVPTPAAKVKAYVRVRAARKELGPDHENLQEINGDYCWAVLFYMLRSGLYQEALGYVEENQGPFRQIDRSFVRYLRAYVNSEEHRLPPDMQTAINNEFSQRQRLAPEDSIDPYRMICYKVIGRCDLNRRSLDNITNDMFDWIWLQFSMARDYIRVDEFAHEAFGLDELRNSIKEIGERYFGAGSEIANAPTTFFFMQILAGMFEKAVADLYPQNYVSATHFAVALDFYGLLRVSDITSSDDLLTFTTRQQPQVAFGSMVGLYTRDFRTADSTAAVDYLTLICLNSDLTGELGKAQRELCYQALIEVTLETREFAQLLGDIRSDGQRIKGAIEQRLKLIKLDNEQEFLKHITLVAARTAEQQSRVTDAALLFHLAEDYDKVIQVVNEAVSLALTTELGEQSARLTPLKPRTQPGQKDAPEHAQGSLSLTAVDDPVDLAKNMTTLYGNNAMYYEKIRSTNRDVCTVLLKLAEARRALEASKWPLVVDVSSVYYYTPVQTSIPSKPPLTISFSSTSPNPASSPHKPKATSPPSAPRPKPSTKCPPCWLAPSPTSCYGRSWRAATRSSDSGTRNSTPARRRTPSTSFSRRPRMSWCLLG